MAPRTEPPPRLPDPALWVERYGDGLFRYAFVRVRRREIAEDLVQETFLAALRARDQFGGRSSFRTWLTGILRRKIVDHIRRESRRSSADLGAAPSWLERLFDHNGKWRVEPTAWGSDPSAALEQKEFWEVFQRCLAKLPARLADAFTLWELDELSSQEVRQILNVSANNLWVLLHRARLGLARCLDVNWFHHTRDRN